MSLLTQLSAATPSPSPTSQVVGSGSPGFIGFLFTFLLAGAAVLLFLSLTKHLRVVQRRSQELDDETAETTDTAETADATDAAGRPHPGVSDVGAAGADLEVDADVDVGFADFVPPEDEGKGPA